MHILHICIINFIIKAFFLTNRTCLETLIPSKSYKEPLKRVKWGLFYFLFWCKTHLASKIIETWSRFWKNGIFFIKAGKVAPNLHTHQELWQFFKPVFFPKQRLPSWNRLGSDGEKIATANPNNFGAPLWLVVPLFRQSVRTWENNKYWLSLFRGSKAAMRTIWKIFVREKLKNTP